MIRIARTWYDICAVGDGITLITEPHVHPILRCNIWHVRGRERDLVIDSGLGIVPLREAAAEVFENAITAVATHAHLDHVGALHEFNERLVHPLEAGMLAEGNDSTSLRPGDRGEAFVRLLEEAGYEVPSEYLLAYPSEAFDVCRFRIQPAPATTLIDEGDAIDLGNRRFEILHLPGHSPGSIGLWEEATNTLFSGDAIYDGPLLDNLPESDLIAYAQTMKRLQALPVTVVHGGHETSFGRDKLREIVARYLAKWGD